MAEGEKSRPEDQKKEPSKPSVPRAGSLIPTITIPGIAFPGAITFPVQGVSLVSGIAQPVFKSEREQQLERDISKLKSELSAQQKAFQEEITRGTSSQSTVAKLQDTVAELRKREQLSFVLNRIHGEAKQAFLESPEFQAEFLSNKRCEGYVMAVDLRRSTELMLKSRRPDLFAQFIVMLTNDLRGIVLDHHGVFDKFTGDGILAFFPDFYTGSDAGYYVMAAAERCHQAFAEHYRRNHSSFYTVIKDVGLGIGIDYGDINLVVVGEELAIVGNPVVYASRMAGTRAGNALLNQPAYEKLHERFSMYCSLTEDEIDIKHEGVHIAYSVRRSNQSYTPNEPAWRKFVKPVAPEA